MHSCRPARPSRGAKPALRWRRSTSDRTGSCARYACLRPYRAGGFVVRRDQLGDKALVHNYGHGGAGITLSWGTSQLAAQLGLAGHSGPVAVIGAGVMGLTTARLVQEAGLPVTIYTAELPPDTTSQPRRRPVGPDRPLSRSGGHSRMARAISERAGGQLGAIPAARRRPLRHPLAADLHRGATASPSPGLEPYYSASRLLGQSEHPFAIDNLAVYRTMYVEVGRYLSELAADFLRAGGQMKVRRFGTAADLTPLPERLMFNCTGLGARELFGDEELGPIRGQIVMLAPQPEVQYAYTLPDGYMFPRGDGIVLGGTFERGVWETTPDPQTIAGIIESHRNVFASVRCTA